MNGAAEIFLSGLQRKRLQETGMPAPPQDRDEVKDDMRRYIAENRGDLPKSKQDELLAKYVQNWGDEHKGMPSTIEDPIVYQNIRETADAVQEIALKLGFPHVRDQVILGTLDSGRISATTYYLARAEKYVLTVNIGLWVVTRQLAWIITQAIAEILPILPSMAQAALRGEKSNLDIGSKVWFQLYMNPMLQTKFEMVLLQWAIRGRVHPAPTAYSEKLLDFGRTLQHSIKAFTLAHEHAHIYLGHYRRGEVGGARNLYDPRAQSNEYKEYEADESALYILQGMSATQLPPTFDYAGAAAYFTISDILSRVLGILKYDDENVEELSESHPQPLKRWSHLQHTMGNQDLNWHIALAVEVALRIMWKEARPAIQEARNSGASVATVWQSQAPIGGRLIEPYLPPPNLNSD